MYSDRRFQKDRLVRGFSLMELLVILSVITLLVTVAVPNYQSIKAYFDIQGSSRQLVSLVAAARANAIRLGQSVVMCRRVSHEQSLCAGSQINSAGNWSAGWLLFADIDDNQQFDGTDRLLKEGLNAASGCEISGRGDYLSFSSEGILRGGGNGTFAVICSNLKQELVVNILGRVRYGEITEIP